jgi:hypothetical protein
MIMHNYAQTLDIAELMEIVRREYRLMRMNSDSSTH